MTPVLDLHSVHHNHGNDLQKEIELKIDAFFKPYLLSRSGKIRQVEIVVGRGLHSKTSIGGTHPIRYYAQQYIQKLGYEIRLKPFNEGTLLVYL